MELIDKSALVAEIRKRLLPVIRDKHYDEWEEGQDSERIAILDIIDTLEVKEVDLEKEIQQHINDCLNIKFPTTDIRVIAKDVEYTARKFFELGLKSKGEFIGTINFSWKPITEIPTEHWERNDAISPLYLVRCGEKNGVSILGYSHYSFATKQWMDCYSTTDTDYDVMHKVTEWTDVKI